MSSHVPLLTVAIPTCNGVRHLAETLRSILNQECPAFDLLVADDASDDQTVNLVREIAGDRARIVINDQRLGLAGNWNLCMARARTPWVNIFHQDDVMLPGHLAAVFRGLELAAKQQVPTGFLAGPVQVIDEAAHPIPDSVIDPGDRILRQVMPAALEWVGFPPGDFAEHLRTENSVRCSAVITNHTAHAELGGFDPSYRYVVDWEFWYRVASRYAVSWKAGAPTVLVRWHAASETQRFKTGANDLDEIDRLVRVIHPTEGKSRRQAGRNLSRAYLNRAHDALNAGQVSLARACLSRAWALSSATVIRTGGTDPRLGLKAVALALSPRLASRWFANG